MRADSTRPTGLDLSQTELRGSEEHSKVKSTSACNALQRYIEERQPSRGGSTRKSPKRAFLGPRRGAGRVYHPPPAYQGGSPPPPNNERGIAPHGARPYGRKKRPEPQHEVQAKKLRPPPPTGRPKGVGAGVGGAGERRRDAHSKKERNLRRTSRS